MYIRVTRDPSPVIFGPDYEFAQGKAVLLRDGADVALISTGVEVVRALEAAKMWAQEGIAATVLHVPTVKPLDVPAVVAAARRTGRAVTADDHSILGGLGGAVAEVLGEHCPTPMRRVGLMDTFGESGPDAAILEKYGLTARHIAAAARDLRI